MPFTDYGLVLELRQQLAGTQAEITSHGSADYAESIRPWSETCKSEAICRRPMADTSHGAVVDVTCTREVGLIITFARDHHVEFVSATKGGIVISLDRMREVSVDSKAQTARVQGGARWDDVNRATAPYGLAVVGATASQTGVGGSTLGGGYGWLTGRYGLIIDSLIRATVVLANGSVYLFWAIRGAGQAFGVVTEFEFRAHEVPDQNGSQDRAMAFFAPLLALDPVINRTGMMPYWQLAQQVSVRLDSRSRKSSGGTKLRLSPLEKDLAPVPWRDFDQVMQEFPRMGDSVLAIEMLPFSKLLSVPVEATACANRDRLYNVGLLLCWHDPRLDVFIDRYRQATLAMIQDSQCWARVAEGGVAAYPNYAGGQYSNTSLK
ncbi:hypothetical protein BDW71DRAFT_196935 [Aspergillus fruticulosus]